MHGHATPPIPMARWFRCVLSILVVLTSGCGHTQSAGVSVASVAGAVYPMNTLQGVYLGTTARSVRELRPGAAEAPYVGLVEPIENDSVFYRFQNAPIVSEKYLSLADGGVPPEAVLTTVELHVQPDREDEPSRERWRGLREKLRAVLGAEDECFELRQPSVTSHAAAWHAEGYDLTLLFTPKWTASSIVTGEREFSPLVRLVINWPSAPLPGLAYKESVECD